jgi:hypothetical protein
MEDFSTRDPREGAKSLLTPSKEEEKKVEGNRFTFGMTKCASNMNLGSQNSSNFLLAGAANH